MSTVVAQPYSTAGNGGRKLVRLSNGMLIGGVYDHPSQKLKFYKSTDNGNEWTKLNFEQYATSASFSIVALPDNTIVSINDNSDYQVGWVKINTATGNRIDFGDVDVNQTTIGNVSLTTNPQGTELHAAWASKNSTYPGSFNIRYAKGTINADGSVTWGAVEQWTRGNNASLAYANPTIVIDDSGRPIIITTENGSNLGTVIALSNSNTLFNPPTGYFAVRYKIVYNGGSYAQSSPSAVVDKDGVIHVAWHGKDVSDNTFNAIRYSKSVDGGITWSTVTKLTTGNTTIQELPSITVDKNNIISVLWKGQTPAGSIRYDIYHITASNGVWSAVAKLTESITGSSMHNPSTMYDPTFSGAFGAVPPTIYEDEVKSSVEYTGSYVVNSAPIITATMPPSGEQEEKPTFQYTVTDAESDAVTITEMIDNVITNTRTGVASGTALTFSPPDDRWLATRINQEVQMTITADDGKGGVSTVNYPIVRTASAIEMQLKNPFETDSAGNRLLLNLTGSIPFDADIVVQACNNAFDEEPTWENAAGIVRGGIPHIFTNKIKTADKWGISFKIGIKRGTSEEEIILDNIDGAFD